jgi:hypothetical protein
MTQPDKNINRILVKTPNEKIILHTLKKEVVNTTFTINIKSFKQLKHEKSLSHSL